MKTHIYKKILLATFFLSLILISAQKKYSKTSDSSNEISQNVMQQKLSSSLKINPLSDDNFSQGNPIVVTGKGLAGTKVYVFLYINWQNRRAVSKTKMKITDQEKQTIVSPSGEWTVSFLPLNMSENQYDVSISVSAFLSHGSYSSGIVSRIYRLKTD